MHRCGGVLRVLGPPHRSMTSLPEERGGWLGKETPEGQGSAPGKQLSRLAPPSPHPQLRPQGPRRVAATGQGHWSQAQSQWAAAAAWLRNLVVSGRPEEPGCLPCVYLVPWSNWKLDLRGEAGLGRPTQGSPGLPEHPRVIWGDRDQELMKGVPRPGVNQRGSLWEHGCCSLIMG